MLKLIRIDSFYMIAKYFEVMDRVKKPMARKVDLYLILMG
jgi:hypothetical protein